MNKLSKILTLSTFLATSLFSASMDETILDFEKKSISQNPSVKLNSVKINLKKEVPLKGWYGYILDVNVDVKGKQINAKDIIFTDGRYITRDIIDSKNNKSLKRFITPNITAKYYDESKLIAGNHKAKDKIVIFSDPLCPFCMDYVPEVINHVNKNADTIALYYYHFPLLRLHPAAGPLSKIMEVAKTKGIKDLELKVYEADWDEHFNSKESDTNKILKAFNKVFNTSITEDEISSIDLLDLMEEDMKMGEDVMVQGTPTIFVNGKKDNTRAEFEKLGKK